MQHSLKNQISSFSIKKSIKHKDNTNSLVSSNINCKILTLETNNYKEREKKRKYKKCVFKFKMFAEIKCK